MSRFKVFGVALDASDSPRSLMVKHAYIERLSRGKVKEPNYLDPYEAFKASIQIENAEFIGKVPVETWLTPKPLPEDASLITPIDFRIFLDSNGSLEYCLETERFVKEKILPDLPLLVAASHSPVGGVLKAIVSNYNARKTTIIVFDAHFDAIPSNVRLKLAQYARDHGLDEYKSDLAKDFDPNLLEVPASYNCGTFLNYLLRAEIIHPSSLILFGVADHPTKEMQEISDPRVQEFVNAYLSFKQNGVQFIPKMDDQDEMVSQLEQLLSKNPNPYLYVSFDVDVAAFEDVLATRFLDAVGLRRKTLIDAFNVLNDHVMKRDVKLVGLDFNEIDVHFLGARLKSGKEDKTLELIQDLLNHLK
ncbi:MAG: arginase family protein [Candidatus Helarchaeales archaeon]